MMMKPKEVVQRFVKAFNNADADVSASLYSDNAVNHQVAERPVAHPHVIRNKANRRKYCLKNWKKSTLVLSHSNFIQLMTYGPMNTHPSRC